jgi:hydroxyethylthiazole kinase-like uncharacterized protein yjeF
MTGQFPLYAGLGKADPSVSALAPPAGPGLYSAAQVRELDRRAIHDHGVPGYTLMQRAALACWDAARARWPQAREVAIVCGSGNNGGDGFEIARLARAAGCKVRVLQVGAPPAQGDGATAHQAWLGEGGAVSTFHPAGHLSGPGDAGDEPFLELIFDALFGTGLSRAVEGEALAAIQTMRRAHAAGAAVVAVDIPSGLAADDGRVLGEAVQADLTVSFIGLKLGLFSGAGPALCGECVFDSLAVPMAIYTDLPPLATLLEPEFLHRVLVPRQHDAHKGNNGRVLIVGGAPGTAGAVLLAGRAALRAGAGLVSIVTHPDHAAALVAAQPELMVTAMADPVAAHATLAALIQVADVVAIGPGLGQADWGRALWHAVRASGKPLVVDADALNLLAAESALDRAQSRSGNWVLTPHPGEAARLLGTGDAFVSAATVQSDRLAAVHALQARYGGVIVLKGAGSLIASREVALCPFGNPGMGVGGMGDALTGIIAALIGQLACQGSAGSGVPTMASVLEVSARAGVLAHACAGDRAARDGQRGLLPSDVIAALRSVVNPE